MKRLLKFGSPTCGPCKLQSQILEKLNVETGVEFEEIDATADESEELLDKYGINNVPSIVVIDEDGSYEVLRGLQQYNTLKEKI